MVRGLVVFWHLALLCCIVETRSSIPEPTWHRLVRKKRQKARALLRRIRGVRCGRRKAKRIAKAVTLLRNHHSWNPNDFLVPLWNRSTRKMTWMCGTCQLQNDSSREYCRGCNQFWSLVWHQSKRKTRSKSRKDKPIKPKEQKEAGQTKDRTWQFFPRKSSMGDVNTNIEAPVSQTSRAGQARPATASNSAGTTLATGWQRNAGIDRGRGEVEIESESASGDGDVFVRRSAQQAGRIGAEDERSQRIADTQPWAHQQVETSQCASIGSTCEDQSLGSEVGQHDQINLKPVPGTCHDVPSNEAGSYGSLQQKAQRTIRPQADGDRGITVHGGEGHWRTRDTNHRLGAADSGFSGRDRQSRSSGLRPDPRRCSGGCRCRHEQWEWGRRPSSGDWKKRCQEDAVPRIPITESCSTATPEAEEAGQVSGCMNVHSRFKDFVNSLHSMYEPQYEVDNLKPAKRKCIRFHTHVSVHCWYEADEVQVEIPCVSNHVWLRRFWTMNSQIAEWGSFVKMKRIAQHVPWMMLANEHSLQGQESFGNDSAAASGSRHQGASQSEECRHEHVQSHTQQAQGSRRSTVVTWCITQDMPVCAHSRRVRYSQEASQLDFKFECRRSWQDVLDDDDFDVIPIAQPSNYDASEVGMILVQHRMMHQKAILARHHGWVPLSQKRAFLIDAHSRVSHVFQICGLEAVCHRIGHQCALHVTSTVGNAFLTWNEETQARDGDFHDMIIRYEDSDSADSERESSLQEDDDTGGQESEEASTVFYEGESTDQSDDDVVALTSLHKHGVISCNFEDPVTRVREEWNLQQMEEDVDIPMQQEVGFAEGHEGLIQNAVRNPVVNAVRNDGRSVAITFGLGVANLGRRDAHYEAANIGDLKEKIREAWIDFVNRADAEILMVTPQPVLDPAHSIVLIVAFLFDGVRNDDVSRVLVIEESEPDTRHAEHPYAALLDTPTNARRIAAELGHQECFPLGIRSCEAVVAEHFMSEHDLADVPDGALVNTYVGAYPEAVRRLQHIVYDVEKLFMDARSCRENRMENLQITVRAHGISPTNRPLGHRDVICNLDDLVGSGWFRQIHELWPFGVETLVRMAYVPQIPEGRQDGMPIFHVVVSFARSHAGVPILIQQTMQHDESAQVSSEMWAVMVDKNAGYQKLMKTLDRSIFWNDEETFHAMLREGRPIDEVDFDWYPGSLATLRLFFFSQRHMLSWRLRHASASAHVQQPMDHTNLLQVRAERRARDHDIERPQDRSSHSATKTIAFAEICQHLRAEVQPCSEQWDGTEERLIVGFGGSHPTAPVPSDKNNSKGRWHTLDQVRRGQNLSKEESTVHDPNDEADRLCRVGEEMERELSQSDRQCIESLNVILHNLRQPLNIDFAEVPQDHPMIQFALEHGVQEHRPSSRFHVFTDGSFQKAGTDANGEKREQTAAWAFVVVCEYGQGDSRRFARIGYAASPIHDEFAGCPPCAATAEAIAIIAMAQYVLSIPAHAELEINCHFDATAVGFGAFGWQKEPAHSGKVHDIQHVARIMISLLQQVTHKARPIHVKAHEGSPYNEWADSIAGATRRGWRPPIAPELKAPALQNHVLRDWAWMEIMEQREFPGLENLLKNQCIPVGKGWQDRVLDELDETKAATRYQLNLSLATINVGTMGYGEENHSSVSYKARELARQFSEEAIDVVGLQETRARAPGCTWLGDYLRLISAGQGGQAGVELWINTQALRLKTGKMIDPDRDVCVWHTTHRVMAVTISCEAVTLDIVVCYAPQKGRPEEEIREWWQQLHEVISARPTRNSMIWLGDWNCRLGSVPTDQVGDLAADEEDTAGAFFRELCAKFAMVIPSTFASHHEGQTWTYQSVRGFRSRVDFIAIHESMLPGVVKSCINPNIDPLNGDHDHVLAQLDVRAEQVKTWDPCLRRTQLYDREQARKAKATGTNNVVDRIPCCDWNLDVNAHWSTFRDKLQDEAYHVFPKSKRQKRQIYFSEKCWQLVCHRKDLRQMHRQQQRDMQFTTLKAAFRAWKDRECDTAFDRLALHMSRLQMAMTLKMRHDLDARFRRTKKIEWKAWVVKQVSDRSEMLQGASITEMYKILQPKRMIERNKGAKIKDLPGFVSQEGKWAIGQRSIAMAWQSQFAQVENANKVQMQEMLQRSVPSLEMLTVSDLQELPTLYQVEGALRTMRDTKAPGLDAIGAELLQIDSVKSSQRVFAIILKSATRRQTIPDFTGGWLIPLHKGRGSKSAMSNYRGIMLEPVTARIASRSWRPRLERALADTAAPMQRGGRKGLSTESLHLQTRLWQSTARARHLALSLIFVDIRAAFHCSQTDLGWKFVTRRWGSWDCDQATSSRDSQTGIWVQHEEHPSSPDSNRITFGWTGCSYDVARYVVWSSERWVAFPSWDGQPARGPHCWCLIWPDHGSLPANSSWKMWAWRCMEGDAQYNRDSTRQFDLGWRHGFWCFWVKPDDPQTDLESLGHLHTSAEFGLTLSVGAAKTALLINFQGRGSIEARQKFEAAFPVAVPVVTEHHGIVEIPLVNQYKHLGGLVTRGANIMTEVKARMGITLSRIRPFAAILRDTKIDLKKRQILLRSLGLSVATVHVGTWFHVGAGEFQVWQGLIHRLYSMLQCAPKGEPHPHVDAYELAEQADSEMPMELLHVARLRLFVQMVGAQDHLTFAAILANHENAKEQSWLAALQRSCMWWKEQVGCEVLPEQLDRLDVMEAWYELASKVRNLKQQIRAAQLSHRSRVRTLCELRRHSAFQQQTMIELGATCDEPVPQTQEGVQCDECGYAAVNQAALAVHQSKKHGARIAVRKYAEDATRRCCRRHYHTRPRLLQHLYIAAALHVGSGTWDAFSQWQRSKSMN